MIEFKNVNKVYDGSFPALEELSLEISAGEFVFFVGPSESGKSSIFRLLTRMEKPTAGYISVNGVDIGAMKRKKVPYYRRELGIIFQDPRLFPKQTVFENIALALRVVGEASADVRTKSHTALKMVELADVASKTPGQLTAFDQQRVALARALAGGARIIIADEPTGNLDPVQAKEFIELLMRIHSRYGKTVLVFTGGKEFAEEFGQRIIFLSRGVVQEDRAAVHPLITVSDEEAVDEYSESESEYTDAPYDAQTDESTQVFTAVHLADEQAASDDTKQFDAIAVASDDTKQFDAVSTASEDTVQFTAVSLSTEAEAPSMEDTVVNLPIVPLPLTDETKSAEAPAESADEGNVTEPSDEGNESEPSAEEPDEMETAEAFAHTTTFDAVQITDDSLRDVVMKFLENAQAIPVEENAESVPHHRTFSDLTVSDDWSGHGREEDSTTLIEKGAAEEDVQ